MRGESVWLSQASCKCALELVELLKRIDMSDDANNILAKRATMMENILRYGWEKDHFIYGFNDNGEKIGSYESIDGNNYLNPQTWAVLSEVLPKDKLNTLMDYVEDTLQCNFGYVQVDPPHINHNDNIGRVTYFAPGCYENGSVYNHGCTFKIVSDCMLGRGDEALKTVNYILPTNPLNPSEKSGMEPYAIANQYLGPKASARVGESPMHWITGTCGWLFRGIVEYMLGVQADYEGLRIVPAMPKVWKPLLLTVSTVVAPMILPIHKTNTTARFLLRLTAMPLKVIYCHTSPTVKLIKSMFKSVNSSLKLSSIV